MSQAAKHLPIGASKANERALGPDQQGRNGAAAA